ncbi:MAG: SUMF1/EgtB/PvdO family nonheme iron enzyme [Deltaproteobacteria bacterium]|nr:SUMF1/EgtB/PvdO family nonheme iron enzyme [Deltaproteobacteria bacterium]
MDERPSVGAVLDGRYTLTERLGEGTYGEIWVGDDQRFPGRRVAIKLLKSALDRDDDATRRFEKEAQALGMLQHPNVVAVIDRGRAYSRPYIVMEYVDGTPLDEWLQVHRDQKRMPELPRVKAIFDQICRGVAAAHAVRTPGAIVHRDLKPANVMLIERPDGETIVKVLDFGIAQLGTRDGTQPGVRFGTPDYMAPEQHSGQASRMGPPSDVFSLGVMLFEMLTLRWYAADEEQWHYATTIRNGRIEGLLTGARAGVPAEVWKVLARALHADHTSRFQDAGALRSELMTAWGRGAARTNWRTSAAIGVGLAVAFGGVLAWRDKAAREVLFPSGPSEAPTKVPPRRAPPPPPPTPPAASPCPEGMVQHPGETFTMGIEDDSGEADERPARAVTLGAFCMDRVEVTVRAYAACVTAGRCAPAGVTSEVPGARSPDRVALSPFCNGNREDRQEHPVNCVTWPEAEAYCRAKDLRLPTEAEWEFAARGREGRPFPWGFSPPDGTRLNACGAECERLGRRLEEALTALHATDDRWEATAPVGSFPAGATALGVQDLAGNVAEWTGDRYGPYATGAATDPPGAPTGTDRVVRGGAWNLGEAAWFRGAFRDHVGEGVRERSVGFRCARSVGPRAP